MKFQQACRALNAGGLLVYPTESVFGIGCRIDKPQALKRLRRLKARSKRKGFIILCASIEQLKQTFPELGLTQKQLDLISKKQSHPTTWLLPYKKSMNPLLVGNNNTIAIRVTEHPRARTLCEHCGPIVSSSANLAGKTPAKTILAARLMFRSRVDCYFNEPLGKAGKTSQIIDLLSGEVLRSA